MVFPGYHNTKAVMGLGVLLLLQHPEQLSRLQASNYEFTAGMVEEITRFLSVISGPQLRTALADATIGNQLIKAGDTVLCSLTAANRDDALGEGMSNFDLFRDPVPHVAFGHGIHYCPGGPLTRLAVQIAFPALFRRFPELRLAARPEDLTFQNSPSYAVESLPVTW
jgi:cytochrome P450